jgi:SET family sugar efflux transporter-like MFS transporter
MAVAVSTVVARLSDRSVRRRVVMRVAAAAGTVAMAFFAVLRDYWLLLLLAVTLVPLAGSLYPQSFAYARQWLDHRSSRQSAFVISALRMLTSVAWVAGPPAAGLLFGLGGFTVIFLATATLSAAAGTVVLLRIREVARPVTVDPDAAGATGAEEAPGAAGRVEFRLTLVGFVLLQCASVLGVSAMSLHVTQDLHRTVQDSGLVLGLCAALEIPLMLGAGALSQRMPLRRLVLAGAGCGVLYFAVASWTSQLWVLGLAQLGNAAFVAAITGLGISYVQNMRPGQPGRATTAFTNAYPIGSLMASPVLGAAAQFGYRSPYLVATACCGLGAALLWLARR